MATNMISKRNLGMLMYLIFVLLPIYWLLNMSFKTNDEILAMPIADSKHSTGKLI